MSTLCKAASQLFRTSNLIRPHMGGSSFVFGLDSVIVSSIVNLFTKGDVTWDDSQRQFLAPHNVATLLRHCFKWLQHCCNIATLCCAKNRRCELSRVTSPKLPNQSCEVLIPRAARLFVQRGERKNYKVLAQGKNSCTCTCV